MPARFSTYTLGKAGKLATITHHAATAHARVNPQIRLRTPKNILELAQAMRAMADEALGYYRAAVARAMRAQDFESRANIDELEGTMKSVAADYERVAREFGDELVRQTYSQAKAATLLELAQGGVGVDQVPTETAAFGVSFTQVDRAAMAAIANDMFTDLAGQTQMMVQSAVRTLRTTAGAVLTRELMLGHTPSEAASVLEATLIAQGFSQPKALRQLNEGILTNPMNFSHGRIPDSWIQAAQMLRDDGELKFVDRAGRRWDLRDYCEMAARTKLSIAKNEAAIATMADADVNLWTVNDVGDLCRTCTPYEDHVWWTGTGDSMGFDRASEFPPFHPNCLHYVIPYVAEAYQQQPTAGAE